MFKFPYIVDEVYLPFSKFGKIQKVKNLLYHGDRFDSNHYVFQRAPADLSGMVQLR